MGERCGPALRTTSEDLAAASALLLGTRQIAASALVRRIDSEHALPLRHRVVEPAGGERLHAARQILALEVARDLAVVGSRGPYQLPVAQRVVGPLGAQRGEPVLVEV